MRYSFLLMLLAFCAVSCYEDKGDYDYRPINEIEVDGIEKHYNIERWDTLKIAVSLKSTLSENPDLKFAWYLDKKKIADTRDLDYVITDKAKKYSARFEVTDVAVDSVRFLTDFEVEVSTLYSSGLLVISDCEGHPELSFYNTLNNPQEKIVRNLFELENGMPMKGRALAVEQPDRWEYMGTVIAHTTKAAYQLDPILCKLVKVYDDNSMTEKGEKFDMVYSTFQGITPSFGVAIGTNGKVYPKLTRQDRYIAGSLKPVFRQWSDPLEPLDYDLAPLALSSRDRTLCYDNISGSFFLMQGSWSIPSFDEYQYDVARVSSTYIGVPWIYWGRNIDGGTRGYTSLFFDKNDGRAALVPAHSSSGSIRGKDSLVMLGGHHLAEKSRVVLNSATNLLYYTDGADKLYLINVSDPAREFVSQEFKTELPAGCRITMLKMSWNATDIYVGVDSGRNEKYRGDLYRINAKDGKILQCYRGMGGTIVDILEKEAVSDYEG